DLLRRDPRRGDDGDLSAHAVVDDEVPPRDLADEAREHRDLDILEVERDGGVLGAGPGGEREDGEQGGERDPHRRSYTSVRGASARTMSRATRGWLPSRSRNRSSAAGSCIAVPFTRSTTSPSRSPRRAKRLSSRMRKRRKPAGRPSFTSATAR